MLKLESGRLRPLLASVKSDLPQGRPRPRLGRLGSTALLRRAVMWDFNFADVLLLFKETWQILVIGVATACLAFAVGMTTLHENANSRHGARPPRLTLYTPGAQMNGARRSGAAATPLQSISTIPTSCSPPNSVGCWIAP